MKKALIIGINNYASCPLEGCINDAREITKLLSKNEDGSRNFDTRLIEDILTKEDLLKLIEELFKWNSDTALLYFSGHGFSDENNGGYIVTPDFSDNDWGVSMDTILEIANKSNSKNKVIILDCCFSGKMGSIQSLGGKEAFLGDGVTILTASRSDELSYESNGQGIFTKLLIQGLNGGASDIIGNITTGSIYSYIDQALGAWDQRPIFKTNISSFFALRKVNPKVEISILRELISLFNNTNYQYPLDPSYEFTNTPSYDIETKKPYAERDNVNIFKKLQKMTSVGLIEPVGEEHMYFAAMNNKSCKLTELGKYYWSLIKEDKI